MYNFARKAPNWSIVSFGKTKNYLLSFHTKYAMNKALKIIEDFYAGKHARAMSVLQWKKLYFKKSGPKATKFSSAILYKLATFIPAGHTEPLIYLSCKKTRFNKIKVVYLIHLNY